MAGATVTYNGLALPQQLGKIAYTQSDRQATFSTEFAISPGSAQSSMQTWREWDQEFSISGTWSETYKLNDTGSGAIAFTAARTSCEKVGSNLDSEGRQRVRFSIVMDLQTTGASFFREYFVGEDINEQGARKVSISGEVTGDSTTSATAKFNAGIAAIEATWLSLFGGTYETPRTILSDVDRHNGILRFNRTHVELIDPNNIPSSRDSTIIFPIWSITRLRDLTKGTGGDDTYETIYRCKWAATLEKDKSGFISQYDGAIREHVLSRLISIFGEDLPLILLTDEIDYNRTQQTASGNWSISTTDGDTVAYKETISVRGKLLDWEKIHDGEAFTGALFTAGAELDVVQDVTHVTRRTLPPTPGKPIISGFGGGVPLALLTFQADYEDDFRSEVVGGSTGQTEADTLETTLTWSGHYKGTAGSGTSIAPAGGGSGPFTQGGRGTIGGTAGADGLPVGGGEAGGDSLGTIGSSANPFSQTTTGLI